MWLSRAGAGANSQHRAIGWVGSREESSCGGAEESGPRDEGQELQDLKGLARQKGRAKKGIWHQGLVFPTGFADVNAKAEAQKRIH